MDRIKSKKINFPILSILISCYFSPRFFQTRSFVQYRDPNNFKRGFFSASLAAEFGPICIAQLIRVELLRCRFRLDQIQGDSLRKTHVWSCLGIVKAFKLILFNLIILIRIITFKGWWGIALFLPLYFYKPKLESHSMKDFNKQPNKPQQNPKWDKKPEQSPSTNPHQQPKAPNAPAWPQKKNYGG